MNKMLGKPGASCSDAHGERRMKRLAAGGRKVGSTGVSRAHDERRRRSGLSKAAGVLSHAHGERRRRIRGDPNAARVLPHTHDER